MKYISTKTYGHDIGLSCAFRQWRADSHCRFVHGYALAVKFEFECEQLDEKNWAVDFGSLKTLKGWLQTMLDHRYCVAFDDPEIEFFREGHRRGVLDLVEVPAVGCEKFAEMIFLATTDWLLANDYSPRVALKSVEVREHGANSAIVTA